MHEKSKRKAKHALVILISALYFWTLLMALRKLNENFPSKINPAQEMHNIACSRSSAELPERTHDKFWNYRLNESNEQQRRLLEAVWQADRRDSSWRFFNHSLPKENGTVSFERIAQHRHSAWIQLEKTKHKFFIYSAYFDNRPTTPLVRIIAVTKTQRSEAVKCRLFYPDSTSATTSASIRIIRENWGLPYSAAFVLCPVVSRSDEERVPTRVALVANDFEYSQTIVAIQNKMADKRDANEMNIAVCVKPIHNSYNDVSRMLEFLEVNSILGADHFFFYNSTTGKDVDCLLRKYIEDGKLTVLQWNLNLLSQKEIRTEGIFAALNDCLYRNMYTFSHLMPIDLDELIVPHQHKNLKLMLSRLHEPNQNVGKVGGFSFRNAFFYLQWPDEVRKVGRNFISMRKVRRVANFHPHRIRSKYVVIPERTVELGNHFVWEFLKEYKMFSVDPEIGFLHHYRHCEFGGSDCIKLKFVEDRTLQKYESDLQNRTNPIIKYLKENCELSEENYAIFS